MLSCAHAGGAGGRHLRAFVQGEGSFPRKRLASVFFLFSCAFHYLQFQREVTAKVLLDLSGKGAPVGVSAPTKPMGKLWGFKNGSGWAGDPKSGDSPASRGVERTVLSVGCACVTRVPCTRRAQPPQGQLGTSSALVQDAVLMRCHAAWRGAVGSVWGFLSPVLPAWLCPFAAKAAAASSIQ